MYGIDVNPACKQFSRKGLKILIGSQTNETFWDEFLKTLPGPIDIFIDDGGHTAKQQITTYNKVFPYIAEGGVYLCEDVHSSYLHSYTGAYKKEDTFIEVVGKNLVDDVNGWNVEDPDKFKVSNRITN